MSKVSHEREELDELVTFIKILIDLFHKCEHIK